VPTSPASVEDLVQRLADRMKAQPEDPNGWVLLGRAYAGMQRFDEAREAFAQAVQRLPQPNASVLADYADVLAMTRGRKLAGEPEAMVKQALALEPDHLKALALAGSAAMQRSDYKTALKHWERARKIAPIDSPFAQGLDPGIDAARSRLGMPALAANNVPPAARALAVDPGQPPAPAAKSAASAAAGPRLRVTVELSPEIAGQVRPGDTLFVFARAANGPRMPLAIVRQAATAGTVQVVLDDASAMAPEMRLSGFPQVVVGARITRSGNAMPQTGDLEGESPVTASAGETRVRIERVRP
jgi:cytochrome c-type biogenesis protein CcmH